MKIRAANTKDAAGIAAIWNDMIRNTLATFTTEEKSDADVALLIEARGAAFWVAEADGIQGYVTYGAFRGGPGYAATVEHSVVLAPGARGQGTGRALMQHAMAQAKQQGHRVMIAGISSANPNAVAFHAALGFQQVGLMPEVGQKQGQWLDLILMQKMLHLS